MGDVSIIVPAYNEEAYLGTTLSALLSSGNWFKELIVVDDGSDDKTYSTARQYTDQVLRLGQNQGKSAALLAGVKQSGSPLLLFLDADLGESAPLAKQLYDALKSREADMIIAALPPARKGGFGLVKRYASWGIYKQTGVWMEAPLSGQRAVLKEQFLQTYQGDQGFGFEVGLTIDYLKSGLRIKEVEVPFSHRERGKTAEGFWHRFKQGVAVQRALATRESRLMRGE